MKTRASLLVLAGCASALGQPRPLSTFAPGQAAGQSAAALVHAGDDAWARRAEPGQALAAQGLYLDAAVADERATDGLLGAMRAITFRIEREHGVARGPLAAEAVELGQWCQRRAPAAAACAYRLAIALGQQARERPSTGKDALGRMVSLLHTAIAATPALDDGGPHRVLALVLLHAPAWPAGPGDTDAAVTEARAAVAIAPGAADNQLALGDALAGNGASDDAKVAYRAALAIADAAPPGPDVASWHAAATKALADLGGP